MGADETEAEVRQRTVGEVARYVVFDDKVTTSSICVNSCIGVSTLCQRVGPRSIYMGRGGSVSGQERMT